MALTPLANSEGLSPDEANNAHVHWLMAKVYEELERYDQAIGSFENYLKATRWHSDVLPWRIPLAEKKIAKLNELKAGQSRPRRPARGTHPLTGGRAGDRKPFLLLFMELRGIRRWTFLPGLALWLSLVPFALGADPEPQDGADGDPSPAGG